MTNAEKFQKVFGYYATEMWAKPEKEFLEWINAEALEKETSCRNPRQVDLISRAKRGKWIDGVTDIDARFGRHDFVCSECASFADYFIGGSEDWWDTEKPNYCPHCGADMRGDEQ